MLRASRRRGHQKGAIGHRGPERLPHVSMGKISGVEQVASAAGRRQRYEPRQSRNLMPEAGRRRSRHMTGKSTWPGPYRVEAIRPQASRRTARSPCSLRANPRVSGTESPLQQLTGHNHALDGVIAALTPTEGRADS
jgi:hypothetical protein